MPVTSRRVRENFERTRVIRSPTAYYFKNLRKTKCVISRE